jgi:hypothetical protein
MAEALKNHHGREIPPCIADMVRAAHPRFDARASARRLKIASALDAIRRAGQIGTVFSRRQDRLKITIKTNGWSVRSLSTALRAARSLCAPHPFG